MTKPSSGKWSKHEPAPDSVPSAGTPTHRNVASHKSPTIKERTGGSVQHVPCKFFQKDACAAGTKCPFSHTIVPKSGNVCGYFLKGTCKFGNKCALSHNVVPRGPHDPSGLAVPHTLSRHRHTHSNGIVTDGSGSAGTSFPSFQSRANQRTSEGGAHGRDPTCSLLSSSHHSFTSAPLYGKPRSRPQVSFSQRQRTISTGLVPTASTGTVGALSPRDYPSLSFNQQPSLSSSLPLVPSMGGSPLTSSGFGHFEVPLPRNRASATAAPQSQASPIHLPLSTIHETSNRCLPPTIRQDLSTALGVIPSLEGFDSVHINEDEDLRLPSSFEELTTAKDLERCRSSAFSNANLLPSASPSFQTPGRSPNSPLHHAKIPPLHSLPMTPSGSLPNHPLDTLFCSSIWSPQASLSPLSRSVFADTTGGLLDSLSGPRSSGPRLGGDQSLGFDALQRRKDSGLAAPHLSSLQSGGLWGSLTDLPTPATPTSTLTSMSGAVGSGSTRDITGDLHGAGFSRGLGTSAPRPPFLSAAPDFQDDTSLFLMDEELGNTTRRLSLLEMDKAQPSGPTSVSSYRSRFGGLPTSPQPSPLYPTRGFSNQPPLLSPSSSKSSNFPVTSTQSYSQVQVDPTSPLFFGAKGPSAGQSRMW
ncbi:hypothetical protein IWQ61_001501 [Dispira simplex]|nr:hypothetical protein IWQ61_001501 [Dispira simplex]